MLPESLVRIMLIPVFHQELKAAIEPRKYGETRVLPPLPPVTHEESRETEEPRETAPRKHGGTMVLPLLPPPNVCQRCRSNMTAGQTVWHSVRAEVII